MGNKSKLYPALFICHGNGPLPLLGDSDFQPLVAKWVENIEEIINKHGPPSAIVVVSSYFSRLKPKVGGAAMPAMKYDYRNFPEESYLFQYPAPGDPNLAERMVEVMLTTGLKASLDPKCPYDHAVFVPLMKMFPKADIPVVPISVCSPRELELHIAVGEALRPFRAEGVFFLGSGSLWKHFGETGEGTTFNNALADLLESPTTTPAERINKLCNVRSLPGFDQELSEELQHVLPLLIIAGTAGGNPGREVANINTPTNQRHFLFEE